MTTSFLPFRELTERPIAVAVLIVTLAAAALLALQAVRAQVEGERGITPVASSSDITVNGIAVDVRGDNPQDAREKGWKLAQRLG
ncbi:MAG TPA: heavy-metal-associated domain-containing protein, partial [Sphingomonadaceae bacterium]|nr:heavy-metal-associated domain-containing protein [Sphingomonadaceae bacterium]